MSSQTYVALNPLYGISLNATKHVVNVDLRYAAVVSQSPLWDFVECNTDVIRGFQAEMYYSTLNPLYGISLNATWRRVMCTKR
jgi:hypothetical protein